MIDGIRVDARDQIGPTFRVPAVRIESGFGYRAKTEPRRSGWRHCGKPWSRVAETAPRPNRERQCRTKERLSNDTC
jgi:hypothetical protein